jgi:hypothetical protein
VRASTGRQGGGACNDIRVTPSARQRWTRTATTAAPPGEGEAADDRRRDYKQVQQRDGCGSNRGAEQRDGEDDQDHRAQAAAAAAMGARRQGVPSLSSWYRAAARRPSRILRARRWMVQESGRFTRRRPLHRGQTLTRRGPRRMCPLPLHLHLRQRPNGRMYSDPSQRRFPGYRRRWCASGDKFRFNV